MYYVDAHKLCHVVFVVQVLYRMICIQIVQTSERIQNKTFMYIITLKNVENKKYWYNNSHGKKPTTTEVIATTKEGFCP